MRMSGFSRGKLEADIELRDPTLDMSLMMKMMMMMMMISADDDVAGLLMTR